MTLRRDHSSDDRTNRNANRIVLVLIAIHVLLDLVLLRSAWFSEPYQLVWAICLPLSQCSLVTMWAVATHASLWKRFLIPPLVAGCTWYVLSKLLMWGVGEPAAVAWALSLTVQVLAVLILFHLYLMASFCYTKLVHGYKSVDVTFNLRTLMLWSAIVAGLLGFVQYGRDQWQWDVTVAEWEYINAMPVIGTFNALLAMLCWFALAGASWKWRCLKIPFVAGAITTGGYCLPYILDWTTSSHALETAETLILSAGQSLIVSLSVVAILYANWLRVTEIELDDSSSVK